MHLLIPVPLLPALFAPDAWVVNGWAAISMFIALGLYAGTLVRGAADILGYGEEEAVDFGL